MKMLTEIGEEDNAIPYIKDALAKKEKIMGMGHRVYRKGDPRAKHLKKMSKELTKLTGQEKWYNMSVKIEDYIKKDKGLPANVDFYSARSEEHTSELQSRGHLVCRLLLEKKKINKIVLIKLLIIYTIS